MVSHRKGVYNQATTNSLRGVPLPDKIKCGRCQKFKSQNNFSNKQLASARFAIKTHGPMTRYDINCQSCIGSQIVEIECNMCRKVKGLEAFAKSQRRRPDTAKCYACVEDQLAQEAVQDEIYESGDLSKAFEPAESLSGEYPDLWADCSATNTSESGNEWINAKGDDSSKSGGISLQDFSRKLSISNDYETLIDTEFDRGSQANSNNTWYSVQTKSWNTRSNNTPSIGSGFNPNKYGNPITRSTNRSVSGSAQTFSSGYAERSDATSYKNGWARIKAYNPKKDVNNKQPATAAQDEEDEEWSASSEEDDGDDTDDDTVI